MSYDKFVLATGAAAELNDHLHRQAMFCIEYFLVPNILILGKDTALRCYKTVDIKAFRVEGYEIPVQIVDGEFAYLVGKP